MSYVYFISTENGGPVKIGKADDVEARRRQLQTGNPHPLTVLYQWELPSNLAHPVERRLHATFEASRMQGEWFARTPELMGLVSALRDAGTSALESALAAVVDQLLAPLCEPSTPTRSPLDGFYPGVVCDDDYAWTARADLYAAYRHWVRDTRGEDAEPRPAYVLYEHLRARGVRAAARKGVRGFKGIRIAGE